MAGRGQAEMDAARRAMQVEVEAYKAMQQSIQKQVQARQLLVQQCNENEAVLEELALLDDDANVFKLIGPALIKQDLVEAKSNVQKRLDYIKGELDRLDAQIKSTENKVAEKQAELMKMQQRMQRQVQAAGGPQPVAA